MALEVFLIRSGCTSWHPERLLGRQDRSLTDQGREQCQRCADDLHGHHFAELLSSPLQRALQGAEILSSRIGIPVARDPRLTDLNLGTLAGLPKAAGESREEFQRFLDNPDLNSLPSGESLADVRTRAVSTLEQVFHDCRDGDRVAIVTHEAVVQTLVCHYQNRPAADFRQIAVDFASVTVLSYDAQSETVTVVSQNGIAPARLA